MNPKSIKKTPQDKQEAENETSLIDSLIQSYQVPAKSRQQEESRPLVGECLEARHPTLKGRYLIRWNNPDGQRIEKWLPSLHEITLRKNDRVLILCPANWIEPIVIGMIDGFTPRPGCPRSTGPSITLLKDETIRVTDPDGKKLVEIHQDESGPVVQLFKDDITLDMPGKLCINAKTIELNAKKGDVKIKANDDIVVKGEVIHLN